MRFEASCVFSLQEDPEAEADAGDAEPNGFESRRNDAEPEPEREEGSEAEEPGGVGGATSGAVWGICGDFFLFMLEKRWMDT